MSKLVRFYYDLMSQPSRAMWIGLKLSKTPYEDCPVALRKSKSIIIIIFICIQTIYLIMQLYIGEQLSEEYKKINRFQKVPALVDSDFHLSESVAILRY